MINWFDPEDSAGGFVGRLISEQDKKTDTLSARARSVALLLHSVDPSLRRELLGLFRAEDKRWVTAAFEGLDNLSGEERVQVSADYLEVNVSNKGQRKASLEAALVARLEDSFRADKPGSIQRLCKKLRPYGQITIGEALDRLPQRKSTKPSSHPNLD